MKYCNSCKDKMDLMGLRDGLMEAEHTFITQKVYNYKDLLFSVIKFN